MKKTLLIYGILFSGLSANADMIVNMNLDLVCTENQSDLFDDKAIHIVADAEKTQVTIGEKTSIGPVMMGGTEGGSFYAQYRDEKNGISLDFFGGDIEKLEDVNLIEKAVTPVEFSDGTERRTLNCTGKIGWTPKNWDN